MQSLKKSGHAKSDKNYVQVHACKHKQFRKSLGKQATCVHVHVCVCVQWLCTLCFQEFHRTQIALRQQLASLSTMWSDVMQIYVYIEDNSMYDYKLYF